MEKSQEKIKTILIGTSEFAATIFKKFYNSDHSDVNSEHSDRFGIEVIAVITAPDKPVGRKQKLTPSPVKKWAQGVGLKVLQPEKIREPEWIEKIKQLNPDLIILTAYGQIIPKEILDIPKYGALNIHPSLLPKYRGASPIQAAILNGDKKTGVTIILMDEKMDHGPIIQDTRYKIQDTKNTYEELSEKLADLGAELLIKVLPDWVNGKIKPKPQNHSKATYTKIIKKEDGKINWNKSAEEIERQIRAFHKWPGAYTKIKNKKSRIKDKLLKILEADVLNENKAKKIGKIILLENKKLGVQTGNGILVLKKIQLEGKKPVSAKDFFNGYPEFIESILA